MRVRSFSCAKGQQAPKIKPVNIQSRTLKEQLIWNSVINEKFNIYLYSCKTETVIFVAAKHEKPNMAVTYICINISTSIWTFGMQYHKNQTGKKLKYSSKFLAHIKNICNHGHNNFLMFHQISHPSLEKRSMIVSNKHGI